MRAPMKTTAPETSLGDGSAVVPRRAWGLTIAHHPNPELVGKHIVVFDGATIALGRGERCFGVDVFDDDRVSRDHAEVGVDEAGVAWVSDRKSRNGTLVNGRKIARADLADGDVIGVGRLLFVAHRAPVTYPSASAPPTASCASRSTRSASTRRRCCSAVRRAAARRRSPRSCTARAAAVARS
jgi:hypothetical protein